MALKKDNVKYGFTKEILNESFKVKAKGKEQNKLFDIFNKSLDNIEKLCENNDSKEDTVNNIQNMLLPQEEN